MNYASTLKKLIDLSDLTAKYIANYIGYDNSYVSKWTTGKNIPAPKMHYYINSRLAELFSNSIHGEYAMASLADMFERKVLLISKDLVRTYILRLLQDAYFTSVDEFGLSELDVKERDVFIEWDEILEGVRNILNKAFVNSKNDVRIITTNPMNFEIIVKNDIQSLFYVTRDIPVKYTVLIDHKEIECQLESIEAGILMLLQFGMFDMEVVLVSEKVDNNLIIIEDEVALMFEYYDNSRPKIMTTTTDQRVVDSYANYYNDLVKNSKTIMKSSRGYAVEFDAVRDMVIPDNDVFIYLSFFSGMFLPDKLTRQLLTKHRIPKDVEAYYYEHRKLYEVLFLNTKVNLAFSEEVLHNMIRTRTLNFCGKHITLTVDELKEFMSSLKEYLSKIDNVNYYYYNHGEKGNYLNFSDNKVSVIADKNNTIFIRDLEVMSGYSMRLILFDHKDISNYFYNHLNEKYLGNIYKHISYADLCDMIDRALLFVE